jgi:structural maintenance of chromosome 1
VRRKFDDLVAEGLTYHLDEIVVKDSTVAERCIALCKEHHLGTATFLPLDHLDAPVPEANGPVQPLIAYLEFDRLYEPAIAFVTKGTFVCEDPGTARQMARTRQWKRLIDVNGTIYKGKGVMTGGRLAPRGGRFDRPREVIQRDIENLTEQLSAIQDRLRSAQKAAALAVAEADIARGRLEALESRRDRICECLSTLTQELDEKRANIEALEHQLSGMLATADAHSHNDHGLEEANRDLIRNLGFSNLEELLRAFDRFLAAETAAKELRRRFETLADSRTPAIVAQKKSELKVIADECEDLAATLARQSERVMAAEAAVTAERAELSQCSSHLEAAKTQKATLLKRLSDAERRLSAAKEHAADARASAGRARKELELGLARTGAVNPRFESLPGHLRERKAPAQRRSILAEYDRKIRDQQRARDALRPNFHAQDSLDKCRADIRAVDADLALARPEMHRHILEFREAKRRRCAVFMEFFRAVESSIQEIYARLTSTARQPLGGNAYLAPANQQCPFLDGILFSVVPPLKRHRAISALSGGEQTLAVVSLLFAMNRGRPSAAVILDEIDAALDSRNLRMLSIFLKAQAEERQIIVISHRDSVYAECNSLVGVCKDPRSHTSMTLYLPLTAQEERGSGTEMTEPESFSSMVHFAGRLLPTSDVELRV